MIRVVIIIVFSFCAITASAETPERVRKLYDLMSMPALFETLQEEGVNYGDELEAELFPRNGGETWREVVRAIYRLERLEKALLAGLDRELSDDEIAKITVFFESDLGQRVVGLEVAARRALLDDAVEEAASLGWLELEEKDAERWKLLGDFVSASDLVEANVAGAMTANYAFYQGLMDGNAFEFTLTEQEILSDVWAQEPQIRADIVDWVYSFTSLAYQPLSNEDLAAYLAFIETPDGKALNAALFVVFNELFVEISHELGVGAAHYVSGDDI